MRTDEDQEAIDRASEARIKAIVTLIRDLTANEHRELIERLRAEICLACGSDNRRCQCENDE
jgi:hypothetical protein